MIVIIDRAALWKEDGAGRSVLVSGVPWGPGPPYRGVRNPVKSEKRDTKDWGGTLGRGVGDPLPPKLTRTLGRSHSNNRPQGAPQGD